MSNSGFHQLKLKTVDQISIAVKEIDKVIESGPSMFGIGPWTFRDLGGSDAKGRPWKAKPAFAYLETGGPGGVIVELRKKEE